MRRHRFVPRVESLEARVLLALALPTLSETLVPAFAAPAPGGVSQNLVTVLEDTSAAIPHGATLCIVNDGCGNMLSVQLLGNNQSRWVGIQGAGGVWTSADGIAEIALPYSGNSLVVYLGDGQADAQPYLRVQLSSDGQIASVERIEPAEGEAATLVAAAGPAFDPSASANWDVSAGSHVHGSSDSASTVAASPTEGYTATDAASPEYSSGSAHVAHTAASEADMAEHALNQSSSAPHADANPSDGAPAEEAAPAADEHAESVDAVMADATESQPAEGEAETIDSLVAGWTSEEAADQAAPPAEVAAVDALSAAIADEPATLPLVLAMDHAEGLGQLAEGPINYWQAAGGAAVAAAALTAAYILEKRRAKRLALVPVRSV
jgi:hypothetical protein